MHKNQRKKKTFYILTITARYHINHHSISIYVLLLYSDNFLNIYFLKKTYIFWNLLHNILYVFICKCSNVLLFKIRTFWFSCFYIWCILCLHVPFDLHTLSVFHYYVEFIHCHKLIRVMRVKHKVPIHSTSIHTYRTIYIIWKNSFVRQRTMRYLNGD